VIRLAGAGKTTQIDRKGGQHPVWDEEFRIDVFESQDKDDRILKVNVFSKQRKIDDLIGEGRIDITEALAKGEFDGELLDEIIGALF
jgi:Ca2+-dependent lipid-binding protein